MKTTLRLALATFATALSPFAFAHATVVGSFPAKDQAVTGSPSEIHLTFSEHVDPRSCRIKLLSRAGKNFDADRPQAAKNEPNTLVAAVPVLKPGTYSARWVATGSDGKRVRGEFSFTVQ